MEENGLEQMIELLDYATYLLKDYKSLKYDYETLRLDAGRYLALFKGKYELAEKLQKQVSENKDFKTGAFDGFMYSSIRANAKFRTLADMYEEGILSKEEYDFVYLLK